MGGNFDHPSDTEHFNNPPPPISGNHHDAARMVSGGNGNVSGGETPVY